MPGGAHVPCGGGKLHQVFEDQRVVLGRDAGAAVAHLQRTRLPCSRGFDVDTPTACGVNLMALSTRLASRRRSRSGSVRTLRLRRTVRVQADAARLRRRRRSWPAPRRASGPAARGAAAARRRRHRAWRRRAARRASSAAARGWRRPRPRRRAPRRASALCRSALTFSAIACSGWRRSWLARGEEAALVVVGAHRLVACTCELRAFELERARQRFVLDRMPKDSSNRSRLRRAKRSCTPKNISTSAPTPDAEPAAAEDPHQRGRREQQAGIGDEGRHHGRAGRHRAGAPRHQDHRQHRVQGRIEPPHEQRRRAVAGADQQVPEQHRAQPRLDRPCARRGQALQRRHPPFAAGQHRATARPAAAAVGTSRQAIAATISAVSTICQRRPCACSATTCRRRSPRSDVAAVSSGAGAVSIAAVIQPATQASSSAAAACASNTRHSASVRLRAPSAR